MSNEHIYRMQIVCVMVSLVRLFVTEKVGGFCSTRRITSELHIVFQSTPVCPERQDLILLPFWAGLLSLCSSGMSSLVPASTRSISSNTYVNNHKEQPRPYQITPLVLAHTTNDSDA